MLVIPGLRKLRQEDGKFDASLSYIRSYLKKFKGQGCSSEIECLPYSLKALGLILAPQGKRTWNS
jgi:hypothetical protein